MLTWSAYGAQATTAGRPPASSMVLLGIEHVAMYDTAVALGLRGDPFVVPVAARPGTSAAAATATAAHDVLVARVPAQRAFLDDSNVRTAGPTAVAQFWAENTATQWHRAVLELATARRLGLGPAARLLAMVFVAAGDAGIACFDAKYHFMSWRPVQAIRRADTDGNPRTVPIRPGSRC